MRYSEMLQLWQYVFKHMSYYENEVRRQQENLRYKPVTAEEALRLIQAQTALETYMKTINEIRLILKL